MGKSISNNKNINNNFNNDMINNQQYSNSYKKFRSNDSKLKLDNTIKDE